IRDLYVTGVQTCALPIFNVITAARLEPIVRENEIWCTNSFKDEAKRSEIDQRVQFQLLGTCELAKGWSEEQVYALYLSDEEHAQIGRASRRERGEISVGA